jgi:hypothetical protein
MIRLAFALLLALPAAAAADHVPTADEMAAFTDYKVQLAAANAVKGHAGKADAHKALALHQHCQTLGYVRAWRLETAAWHYLMAGKDGAAIESANAALEVKGITNDCAAKAHAILGQIAGRTGDGLDEAERQYRAAVQLDPGYDVAREGLDAVQQAKRARNGSAG